MSFIPNDLKLKGYRYPVSIISHAVWCYHRFNDSYRDISERLLARDIVVSHETIRTWCIRFAKYFVAVIKMSQRKPTDKWHLDEMYITMNGILYVLWRAVDSEGLELDVLVQRRKDKKSAIRFFKKLLGSNPTSVRVIVTDKLPSYNKPIQHMLPNAEHRKHKELNNRVENAHQPTRRKGKCLIRFKHPSSLQRTVELMGKTRNLFAIMVSRYKQKAHVRRFKFKLAMDIWKSALQDICI